MTSGDDRRAMPPSDFSANDDPAGAASNPFKPVSMQNRITGTGRGNAPHAHWQPAPGSRYDFGDNGAQPFAPVPFSDAPEWEEGSTPYLKNERPGDAPRYRATQPFAPPLSPGTATGNGPVIRQKPGAGASSASATHGIQSPTVPDWRAAAPLSAGVDTNGYPRAAQAPKKAETNGDRGKRPAKGGLPPIKQIPAEDQEDPWVALGWKAPVLPQGNARPSANDRYPSVETADTAPYAPGTGTWTPPISGGNPPKPYLSPFSDDDFFESYLPPTHDGDFSQPYQPPTHDNSFSQPYQPPTHDGDFSQPYQPPTHDGDFSQPYQPPTHDNSFSQPYQPPTHDGDFSQPYQPPAHDNSFSQPYLPQRAEAVYTGPYARINPEGNDSPAYDTSSGRAPGSGSGNDDGPPPVLPAPAGKMPPRNFRQAMKSSWRMALLIACSLAVVFTVIEVAKMVQSLMVNERQLSADREKYYQMAGVDPGSAPEGVELLAKGQTYAPTATPQAVQTPTPVPRIQQNDPLIGVMDAGGEAANGVEAEQTAGKAAQRTKLSQYPDNLLLSIDEAFKDLREQNGDVVGRLVIDGVLDETLVQRNNTYYLTHNSRKNLIEGGAVFVDEGCSLKAPPENLLLRGQTNVPGKLFEPLTRYGTQGAGYVSGHGIVTCNTIYEKAQYVVFAVIYADSRVSSENYFNYAGYPTFQTDAQMLSFVDSARLHSVYAINVNVQASDRLLTLAALPADGETASWVIICRKLRSGETAGHIQTD